MGARGSRADVGSAGGVDFGGVGGSEPCGEGDGAADDEGADGIHAGGWFAGWVGWGAIGGLPDGQFIILCIG